MVMGRKTICNLAEYRNSALFSKMITFSCYPEIASTNR